MVTAASDNDSVLSAYAQDPKSVAPGEIANAAQGVITSVAARKSVPRSTIQITQRALASLFQSPHPDVIPNLLPVCDGNVPYENVDHFVLCTAAWKALSAAVVHQFSANSVPVALLLQIIVNAAQAAFSMVLRIVAMLQAADASGSASVARWTKVAKFFTLHATRCAQVLSRTNHTASVIADEPTKKLFTDVCAHAMRLLGLLSYACFFSHHEFLAIREDITTGLSPLVTSLTRSLLTTLCISIEQDSPTFALSVLETTHKSFSNPSLFVVDKSTPCPPALLHLFATLQLMRYAASEPSKVTTDANRKGGRDFRALRHIFRPSLCPALFCSLDTCYDKVVTLRERKSQTPLIVTIASVAAECFAVLDLYEAQSNENLTTSLRDSLLIEMSAVNPARALVAAEGLCQIFRALLSRKKPEQVRHCVGLYAGVLKCSQMALTLRSAHAESRWLPLAARMGLLCVDDEGVLSRAFNESRGNSDSYEIELNKRVFHDLFLLRLIHALCCGSSINTDSGSRNAVRRFSSVTEILKCFNLNIGQLNRFVSDILGKRRFDDDLVQCALALTPYVMNKERGCDTVTGCLRQGSISAAAFCTGVHLIQPTNTDVESVSGLIKEARSYVDRYGVVVCAATSAFVSRGVSQSGIVERPALLSEFLGLLRMSVEKVITTGGDEHNAATITALSGSVYYHAAIALSSVTPIATRIRIDVSKIVGNDVLSVIERSQERHMELKHRIRSQGDDDWATILREKEHITTETSACRRGGTRRSRRSPGQTDACVAATSQIEAVQSAREQLVDLLGEMVTVAVSEGDNAGNRRTGLIMELGELRRTVDFIEDWCRNGK